MFSDRSTTNKRTTIMTPITMTVTCKVMLVILFSCLIHTTNCQDLISPTLSSSSTQAVTTTAVSSTVTPIVTPTPSPTTTQLPVITTQPCDSSPCRNGGTCTNVNADEFSCACASGWTGQTCRRRTRIFQFNVNLNCIVVGALVLTPNLSTALQNLLLDTSTTLFRDTCQVLINALRLITTADGTLSVARFVCVRFRFRSINFVFKTELHDNDTSSLQQVYNSLSNGVELEKEELEKNTTFNATTIDGEDFNECAASGYCDASANCTNLIGGFNCSCEPGFVLVDNSNCTKVDGTTDDDDDDKILIIVLPIVMGCLILFVILIVALLIVRRRGTRYSLTEAMEGRGFPQPQMYRGSLVTFYSINYTLLLSSHYHVLSAYVTI